MLATLRASGRNLEFVVATGTPEETAQLHGVETVLWSDATALFDQAARADLIVVGGGGLFHDYFGFDPAATGTEQHAGMAYYTSPLLFAALHGKPAMLYAVGVGPLLSEHGRRFALLAAQCAGRVSVRDEGSRAELLDLGIEAGKVETTADPAFHFTPASTPKHAEGTPMLGVAARDWAVGVLPRHWKRELALALDGWMSKTGGDVAFLPFQQVASGGEDDRGVAERICSQLANPERARVRPHSLAAEVLIGEMVACDVVVAMRLHAFILAVAAGRPVVALNYDPKVGAIAERLGLADFVMDLGSLRAGALGECIAKAQASGEVFAEAREQAKRELAPLAARNAEIALGLLDDPAPVELTPELRDVLADAWRQQLAEVRAATERIAGLVESPDHDIQARTIAALRGRVAAERENSMAAARNLERYREDLEAKRAQYRNEKPWQIMLLLRRAYVEAVASGPLGPVRALKTLAQGALMRPPDLSAADPVLPDVREYVPGLLGARASIAASADRHKYAYDVVIFPVFDFEFRFQRPQQFAVALAKRGHRVFWVSPSRRLDEAAGSLVSVMPLERENIFEVRLKAPQFEMYGGALSVADAARTLAALEAFYEEQAIADSCVLLQFPFWRQLGLGLRARFGAKVVYDQMDDWSNWPVEPKIGEFALGEERQLIAESDVLVVTSKRLEGRGAGKDPAPVLLPNGADFEHFAEASPHAELSGMARPVIGYFGAISGWFDVDLMTAVAQAHPEWTFVLIGQVHERDVSALEELPNTHLLGEKPYAELPAYLAAFDVALIPFLLNDLTHAVDPVKLYEYCAQGKPVVATPMQELLPLADVVRFGATPADLGEAIQRSLDGDTPEDVAARLAFARENTWASRVARLDEAVRGQYPLASIIIVTYNSEKFVDGLMRAVLDHTQYPSIEVIVYDNASPDGTVTRAQRFAGEDARVRVVASEKNWGFAGGNNRAAELASGEFLVFLNADTIPAPGWLSRLLAALQQDPRGGLVASATNYSANESKVNYWYDDYAGMLEFAHERAVLCARQTFDLQVAAFYCVAIRRTLWEELGGLDEQYGVGMFEDDDYSLRVRQAGYRVLCAEDSFVHHFGGGSFLQLATDESRRLFEQNRDRFETKWRRKWTPHSVRPGVLPLEQEEPFRVETFRKP